MKINPPSTVQWIASFLGTGFSGNPEFMVTGINEIHRVERGDIVFTDHPKYYDKALSSKASVVLIDREMPCPDGKILIFSKDPFGDFNRLILRFTTRGSHEKMISSTAVIGEGTVIDPGVFIGNNVVIGKNCRLHSHISVYDCCVIGNNVIIHSNTVIGSDGFYYKKRAETGRHEKFISCGNVIIGDEVEIGACCTIDRGVTHNTVIGSGTKLDNLIQVGHDTVIGKNCLLAAQVGIAGMVTIEDEVTLWGQVGVISNVVIGKGAVVLAQSGVAKSLKGNAVYFGSPAVEAREKMREIVKLKNL
ncbi:MAG: UDP-3-O-(3-hydroxymyristoyl)glucosamine N-acyltransferase [Bacteroidetes bacterium]|nr:UDP-3-O-(3-hydroxymyristoyl)glucosamine N-acyltransferase [Bacteroidota bacterium]